MTARATRLQNAPPRVRAVAISKSFPGVQALNKVSISLRAGEVHALTGENGSGKSTLAKVLAGVHRADEGHVEIDGAPVTIRNPRDALGHGIVSISQELTLAPTLTVAENILLDRQAMTRFATIDWKKTRAIARAALSKFDVDIDETAVVSDLPIESQQVVEIARALSIPAKLLILDEATSSLSEPVAAKLLKIVAELRDAGTALLIVSHRMTELYESASVTTVLRDGAEVATVSLPDTPKRDLVRLMVGRAIEDHYGGSAVTSKGGELLRLRGFSSVEGAFRATDLDVCSGEIVGIAGLVGSGKSEFAKALGGVIPSAGDIRVKGRQVRISNPKDAIDASIGYVPDDRKRAAILPNRSVAENIGIAWLGLITRFGVIRRRKLRSLTVDTLRSVGMSPKIAGRPMAQLSGGNQQKLVLARTFQRAHEILVLDEPTRGIDVGAKSEIYSSMRSNALKGRGIIIVSSELPELLAITDRILVFYQGTVCAEYDTTQADEESITHAAISGHPASGLPEAGSELNRTRGVQVR